METQERIRILELAWELALIKKPSSGNSNEAALKAWHDRFDAAYKMIMKTALAK